MSVFYQEKPPNPSKRLNFLASVLKDACINCHTFREPPSPPHPEEDNPTSDFHDEHEVVVSAIRSRATEANFRRKASLSTGNFFWVFTSTTGEVFTTPEALKQTKDNNGECSGDDDDNEREEFLSVQSYFSHSSSARSRDEFFSIKTNINLLRSRSLSGLDFPDFRRRSIIHKLRHCEGWPFGLCRKALLLPPLPKSPTESWSWRKGSRII